ncbi:MAG: protein-glutamate O-methyltransferase CheR [Eubacteriales bacterium]|jgi:chemotaxis protein methyltransferase CheR|nr:protein-glutamate O-methyltransferase CheR [Eubacteriales bacterium]
MISINDTDFKKLTGYIKRHYGINLTAKRTLVEGRLANVIIRKGFNDYSSYLEHIFSDTSGKEMKELLNILTTNHTFFMREAKHFSYLQKTVLPYLEEKVKDRDLRIWSAGCSTGEEPYTLAMIIDEYFGAKKLGWDTKILATDLSERALNIAVKGRYTKEQIESLPDVWKVSYLSKVNGETFEIKRRIKNEIIFRQFNLLDDFPFKKEFHVIFCRNVMIYFDYDAKMNILEKFYKFLEPGGYLFIGHSESINVNESEFKYVMPSVYRKPN